GERKILNPVEMPEHKQVRESVDVRQTGLELAEDFDRAFDVMARAETLGNLRGFLVRTAYEPYGAGGKHAEAPPWEHFTCVLMALWVWTEEVGGDRRNSISQRD